MHSHRGIEIWKNGEEMHLRMKNRKKGPTITMDNASYCYWLFKGKTFKRKGC